VNVIGGGVGSASISGRLGNMRSPRSSVESKKEKRVQARITKQND